MTNLRSKRKPDTYKLSERQKKMLAFIERCYNDSGYPPTIREIGEAVKIASTSVVNYNLNKLEEAGYIQREKKVSRGLRLLRTSENRDFEERGVRVIDDRSTVTSVPMVGKIVAGEPVPIPEDLGMYYDEDEVIDVPLSLLGTRFKSGQVFALRVVGNSMIDALVNNNDIVVLQRQDTANDGDMVAVFLRDSNETTLKYIYREGPQIRLQPANSMMEPIYVDARNVAIQGRVLAVMRRV